MLSFLNTFLIENIVLESNLKSILLSTCSMKALLLLNPVFDMYQTWNGWIWLFLFSLITIFLSIWFTIWPYSVFWRSDRHPYKGPKNIGYFWYHPSYGLFQQQIPQWNWFAIFPLFRYLNFHIFFLCFKHLYQTTIYLSI